MTQSLCSCIYDYLALVSFCLSSFLLFFFFFFPSSCFLISLRPDGVSFKVPVQKIQPKKGDVVTFSYDSYTVRSVPLNPRIYRIRGDMTWEEAIYNFEQQISDATVTNGMLLPHLPYNCPHKLILFIQTHRGWQIVQKSHMGSGNRKRERICETSFSILPKKRI